MKPLCELDLPWKLLVSLFLLVLSSGFVTAELYLKHTTEFADGKEGLSLDDIVITFHGGTMPKFKQQTLGPMKKYFSKTRETAGLTPKDQADIDTVVAWVDKGAPQEEFETVDAASRRGGKRPGPILAILEKHGCITCHTPTSTVPGNKKDAPLDNYDCVVPLVRNMPPLKQQILGSMKKYFTTSEDVSKLKPDELADIEKVVAWVDKGAPKDDYEYADKEKNRGSISFLLNQHGCMDCHAPDSDMKGNKHDSPLDTYDNLYVFAQPIKPTPIDKGRLLSLSHIHLLGMGMMFMLLGIIVASTLWPVWLRAALIIGGNTSILIDIFGWWGVREYGAPLAWVVMAGGALMGVSFGLSVAVAYWDLWIRKNKGVGSRESGVGSRESGVGNRATSAEL